jgi:hypothetical protein
MVWLQQQIEDLADGEEGKGSFEGQVLLRMWGDERDRVARISEAALRAGVQERMVRLAERFGEQLARMINLIFAELETEVEFDDGEGIPQELRARVVKKALLAVRQEPDDWKQLADAPMPLGTEDEQQVRELWGSQGVRETEAVP